MYSHIYVYIHKISLDIIYIYTVYIKCIVLCHYQLGSIAAGHSPLWGLVERLPGESGEVGRCRSEARGGLREYTKWRAAGHEGAQCHLDSLTKVDFVPENGGYKSLKKLQLWGDHIQAIHQHQSRGEFHSAVCPMIIPDLPAIWSPVMSQYLLVQTSILWLTMYQLPRTINSFWVWNGYQKGGLVLRPTMDENPAEGQQINWCVVLSLPNYVGWNIIANHNIVTMYWWLISYCTYHPISQAQLLGNRWRCVKFWCFTEANLRSPCGAPTKNQELQAYLHCAQLVDLQRGGAGSCLGMVGQDRLAVPHFGVPWMWYID